MRKFKKRSTKIVVWLLTLLMVFGIVPVLPGNTLVAQAAEPSNYLFADKEQLMAGFYPDYESGDTFEDVNAPLLLFGKDGNGDSIKWYILGKDNAIEGDNIMLLATAKITSNMAFKDCSMSSYPYEFDYSYPADSGYGAIGGTIEVRATHWGNSELRKGLQNIAADTNYFSIGEQGMLQETTVKTYDTKNSLFYSTTDKLYCVQAKAANTTTLHNDTDSNNTISIGTDDVRKIKCAALIEYRESGKAWSRTARSSGGNEAEYNTTFHRSGGVLAGTYAYTSGTAVTQPATNINIASVLFASSVDYSNYNASTLSYFENKDMMLRLDGSNKHIGTAIYSDATGRILATKDADAAGTVTLVVQGRSNSQDWFYSKEITGTEYITKEMITTAVSYASGCTFTDCKIWLETGEDNLLYATMAAEGTPINPVALEIDAPVPNVPLDVESYSETEGLVSETSAVTWTKEGNEVTGNAETYSTYLASVILTADDMNSLGFDPNVTATVNGNPADVTHNPDGTITVTYEFQTDGLQNMIHTATGYSGTYDGQAHSIEVTVTDPADATITYSTDGTAYSADKPEYVDAGDYTVYYKIEKINYITVEDSETVVIAKKDMTVTAGDQTINKGESIDASDYSVIGLIAGDTIDSVSLVPDTSDVTDSGTIDIADNFSILNAAGADVTANYNVTLVPGTLVIEEAESTENNPAPPAEEEPNPVPPAEEEPNPVPPAEEEPEPVPPAEEEPTPAPPAEAEPTPAPPAATESNPAPSAPVETPAPQAEVEETVVQNETVSPKTGETATAEVLFILVFGFGAILIEMVYRRRNNR